jgi:PAT family beta-lactamase induction signal transducer AmpG
VSAKQKAAAWADALRVYLRPRVLIVLLLGFSAGLPLALSGETLRVWMADRGVDLGTIGLLSLAGLPYTIKFLWAPVVDALDVPWLCERLGRRRGWLVATQLLLMAAILFLGTRDPVAAPLGGGLGARCWSHSRRRRRTSSSTPTGSRAWLPTSRRPAWPATSPPIASACLPRVQA